MPKVVEGLSLLALCFWLSLSAAQVVVNSGAVTTNADVSSGAPGNLQEVLLSLNATRFVSLINSTGLSNLLLNTSATHTVFAPTNDAIAQAADILNNATLAQQQQILLYHFIVGAVLSGDLTDGQLIPSLLALQSLDGAAQVLEVSIARRGNTTLAIRINDAKVVDADFHASNGVAHLISSVILPPPLAFDLANTTGILSIFAKAIEAAGEHVRAEIVDANNVTVFAPTDDAFSAAAALTGYLLLPNSSQDLAAVLSYHVVPNGIYYASRIPQGQIVTLPTSDSGQTLTVERSGPNVTLDGGAARVVLADDLAANGVVHLISAVLRPPDLKFDLKNALMGLHASILLTQIERAGLEWLLTNGTTTANSTHTIFAPTDAALEDTNAGIAKYPIERLVKLIKTHTINGSVDALFAGQELKNLNNDALVVGSDGKTIRLKVDDSIVATIQGSANVADNGNVYSIDKVLGTSDSDNEISETVVIIVIATCVPFLIALLGVVLLFDLRAWWKKKQSTGYSPISGDEYEN